MIEVMLELALRMGFEPEMDLYEPFAGARSVCPAAEEIAHVCNAKQKTDKEPE